MLSKKSFHVQRERFFVAFKQNHVNLYAIYLMTSIVGIWSGVWYLAEVFAWGQWLAAPGDYTIAVSVRHGLLLVLGCVLLYLDDGTLRELVLMSKTESGKSVALMNGRERFFHYLKVRYPNWMSVYTAIGIIFAWCGVWGLLWDIPLHPGWRSLVTIVGGIVLLLLDDLRLDEL